MRGQKGITLVALIITIVVLLILALVAVNSMEKTSIIDYTKNAAKNWDESVANEQKELGEYEIYLNNASGTGTDTPTVPAVISFTIDSKSYSADRGMTWNQWITSDYNTGGYKTYQSMHDRGSFVSTSETEEYGPWEHVFGSSSNTPVFITESIVHGGSYKVKYAELWS